MARKKRSKKTKPLKKTGTYKGKRKKYGAKKMAKWSAKGRKRKKRRK